LKKTSQHSVRRKKERVTQTPNYAKKKQFGQHFLREQPIVDNMVNAVSITPKTSVMEIGCGDGFLTRTILSQSECKALHIFEIDHDWASYIEESVPDNRIYMNHTNILDVDLRTLFMHQPLVLLANLPYQITFPLLYKFVECHDLFQEGVIMVQEEVAQKMVASRGKPYSAASLYLQHSFDMKLMDKIGPEAFSPPPKVNSRLVYFKPKAERVEIPDAKNFWKFVKLCFQSPRQTLRNNFKRTHYDISALDDGLLALRAQQVTFQRFLELWQKISGQ
jgi:16S rRNA (adenine1518-N6/adenine1519-N6)-dimethyltransferase